jgi:hypothetical protein
MEAGASFHQDPGHMTRAPHEGAVRAARKAGSGGVAFAGGTLQTNGLVLWAVTAHGDEFDG